MYKYFYLGGSSTWGAGQGRGIFFIQFLNSHGNWIFNEKESHVNFVNNLFKKNL